MVQYVKFRMKLPDGWNAPLLIEALKKNNIEAVCWGVLNPIKGIPIPEDFQLQPKYKRKEEEKV